jgi:hypothetical protein
MKKTAAFFSASIALILFITGFVLHGRYVAWWYCDNAGGVIDFSTGECPGHPDLWLYSYKGGAPALDGGLSYVGEVVVIAAVAAAIGRLLYLFLKRKNLARQVKVLPVR